MKFKHLDGVKFLRSKYQRDLQDIDANIEMTEKGGLFIEIFTSLRFGEEKMDHLITLHKIKHEMKEFLKLTEGEEQKESGALVTEGSLLSEVKKDRLGEAKVATPSPSANPESANPQPSLASFEQKTEEHTESDVG